MGLRNFFGSVASAGAGGKIEVRLDKKNGTIVATCTVEKIGGWQDWKTVECDVNGSSDVHDIFFTFSGESGTLFNWDWWQFE